jgi:hypothetical protein
MKRIRTAITAWIRDWERALRQLSPEEPALDVDAYIDGFLDGFNAGAGRR